VLLLLVDVPPLVLPPLVPLVPLAPLVPLVPLEPLVPLLEPEVPLAPELALASPVPEEPPPPVALPRVIAPTLSEYGGRSSGEVTSLQACIAGAAAQMTVATTTEIPRRTFSLLVGGARSTAHAVRHRALRGSRITRFHHVSASVQRAQRGETPGADVLSRR